MTFVVAWLLAPVVFFGLTHGVGLLVERAAGYPLPGSLLAGVGFAGVVCITQLLVRVTPLAPLAPFAIAAAAVAGFVLGRRRRFDRPLVIMALVVFGLYAAPSVFTGHVTFLGYTNEGDGGFHFILAERLVSHGYDLSGLPYSSYSATAANYFNTSYPTGAHAVLGSLHVLLHTDVAWLLEPYLASLVVTCALVLHGLVRPYTRSSGLAAFAAGLAMSGGLVYAYANNQQALKELAALVCIITAVGVLVPLLAQAPSWRTGIPLAVVTAGGMGALSLALAPWIGPVLLAAAVVTVARHYRRWPVVALEMLVFAVVAIVLSLPALTRLGTFVTVAGGALTATQELGNLVRSLPFAQVTGVWPADDFRYDLILGNPVAPVLVGFTVAAAAVGLVAALRGRAWFVLLFTGVSLIGFLAVAGQASPWAYGKALMLLSPVALLLAGVAVTALWTWRRLVGGAVAAVLLAGVVWTDALGYHAASPAPADRLEELAHIGDRFAGQGPALYPQFEEFAKYFLRRTDPSGASEPFRRPVDFAPGITFDFANSYDLDDLDAESLQRFRLIVARRGPASSRPGTGWTRAFHGRFYDVWRRDAHPPAVIGRLRLGTSLDAAADVSCPILRPLARQARGGRLAYSERPTVISFRPTTVSRPSRWAIKGGAEDLLDVRGPGRVFAEVTTGAGRFEVWVAGTLGRRAEIKVDGHAVGAAGPERNFRSSEYHVGSVRLTPGRHEISVTMGGGTLRPGDAAIDQVLGPVALVPQPDPERVASVPARRWRTLCGRHLDWVEAVR